MKKPEIIFIKDYFQGLFYTYMCMFFDAIINRASNFILPKHFLVYVLYMHNVMNM